MLKFCVLSLSLNTYDFKISPFGAAHLLLILIHHLGYEAVLSPLL